jgi:hypothetical protein
MVRATTLTERHAMKVILALALVLAHCGGGNGDECKKEGDCGSNLTCQPIKGRDKLYCCPIPTETSSEENCKPL